MAYIYEGKWSRSLLHSLRFRKTVFHNVKQFLQNVVNGKTLSGRRRANDTYVMGFIGYICDQDFKLI